MSAKEIDMEYNSQRELLIIPEYGRNIQKLIKYAKTIEKKELRQAFVEKVIGLMTQMHPQNRNLEDQREKLWRHVFRIAGFDLEVTPPDGQSPDLEDMYKKPERIGYPSTEARFRHYGNNVQKLIKKALSMEPGPIRDGFVTVIGSYMKLAYKTWNKEHYVSDDIIKADLGTLSNGQLELADNISLDNLTHSNRRRKRSDRDDRKDGRDRDRDRHSNGKGRMKRRKK